MDSSSQKKNTTIKTSTTLPEFEFEEKQTREKQPSNFETSVTKWLGFDYSQQQQDLPCTYEKLGALKLKHVNGKDLSQEWKDQWILQWDELRESIWEFDMMCNYQLCTQIWYWSSLALIYSMLEISNGWYVFLGIFCGFALSQFMFVFSHMVAHAEFLYSYPDPRIWQQKTYHICHGYVESKSVVKYWAFYHHHGNQGGKNDWFPFLGDSTPETSLNTLMIHLHTFTLLFQPYKWLWCVFYAWWSPCVIGWLGFGFNLSAFYLWMGHDWSHSKALSKSMLFGRLEYCLMTIFSFVGINSAREDHFKHHIHTHPTVYQDFSIGETLFPWFMDRYFNSIWDASFYKATLPDGRQHINFIGFLSDHGSFHRNLSILMYTLGISIVAYFERGWAGFFWEILDVTWFVISYFILLCMGHKLRGLFLHSDFGV